MNRSVVVDASVWVSWLRPSESNHSSSFNWMKRLTDSGDQCVVPSILLIEVAAAIARQTGQSLRAKEAIISLNEIETLQVAPIDSTLVQTAINIATDLQLRAGDAIYVALAHQMNMPLVSWDKEQISKAEKIISAYTPDSYPFSESE